VPDHVELSDLLRCLNPPGASIGLMPVIQQSPGCCWASITPESNASADVSDGIGIA
jgi:hypothetical protein